VLDDRAEPRLAREEGELVPLLGGDVTHDRGEADDAARGVSQRRHRDRSVEGNPSLAEANGLAGWNYLTAKERRDGVAALVRAANLPGKTQNVTRSG
jgi:hypothetical protein